MNGGHVVRLVIRAASNPVLLKPTCSGQITAFTNIGSTFMASSVAPVNSQRQQSGKSRQVSRAMKSYLEAASAQEEFIKKEVAEFELGKRHLANIMGWDPNVITQRDIDAAIRYLFPSGLVKKARPIMKHPDELYAKFKRAQFAEDGRPFHTLFYTITPQFYQLLSDIAVKTARLDDLMDKDTSQGSDTPSHMPSQLSQRLPDWISRQELQNEVAERVSEEQYAQLVMALDHLLAHPYSGAEDEFIAHYRRSPAQGTGDNQLTVENLVATGLPEKLETDEKSGVQFAIAKGQRKNCVATARVSLPGSGKITMDGEALDDMFQQASREELLFPFIVLDRLGEFDVEAETKFFTAVTEEAVNTRLFANTPRGYRVAETTRAGAVRLAVSRAITAFLPEKEVERLKLAGLLTEDPRIKERLRLAHKGARAKYKWKAR
jgi:small subunit ribosomal protein S9